MYDRALALAIIGQIDDALETIKGRCAKIRGVEDLTETPSGKERLDGLCMLFMAIGETLKNLDKIPGGSLLLRYPDIDWKGAIGFRNIIAHHYFDIDAEQVFWICSHQVAPLSATIKKIAQDLQ